MAMTRFVSLLAVITILCWIFYVEVHSDGRLSPRPHLGKRYAFATLLAENSKQGVAQDDVEADDYFLATRVLNFQIRYSAKTRYHDSHVPFLVLATPGVASSKLHTLANEGATIIRVKDISTGWMVGDLENGRKSVLSKLYLWTLTDYDRILFIDADTMLYTSLDGVFEDDASQQYATDFSPSKIEKISANIPNASLPSPPPNYILGGIKEGVSGDRQKPVNPDYLDAGFIMIAPSQQMYDYYLALLRTPGFIELTFPEQNLLNYAHHRDGPMPWKELDEHLNTNCASARDIESGLRTVRGHWWATNEYRHEGGSRCDVDPELAAEWWRVRDQMEAYHEQKTVKTGKKSVGSRVYMQEEPRQMAEPQKGVGIRWPWISKARYR
jgi:alpha-N-acetylglucosamine transferase